MRKIDVRTFVVGRNYPPTSTQQCNCPNISREQQAIALLAPLSTYICACFSVISGIIGQDLTMQDPNKVTY